MGMIWHKPTPPSEQRWRGWLMMGFMPIGICIKDGIKDPMKANSLSSRHHPPLSRQLRERERSQLALSAPSYQGPCLVILSLDQRPPPRNSPASHGK